jgi:membrane protein
VLGLIAWIYLGALILVLGAEINTVWIRRLYPRSPQAPDPAAVELTRGPAGVQRICPHERQKRYQTVRSEFDPPPSACTVPKSQVVPLSWEFCDRLSLLVGTR